MSPLKPKNESVSMREMGATGTPFYAGRPSYDENAKFNALATAIPTYKQMENDATLWACYLIKALPIRSAKWWVEAASDLPADKANAEFVQEALFNRMSVTFDRFLSEVCSKFRYGFSCFEKVWKVEEDKVWLKKLAIRLPETCDGWDVDKAGGPKGFKQLTQDGNGKEVKVTIPIDKLLVFVNRQIGANLNGRSDYRACYRNWWTKDKLMRLELIDYERGAVGVPTLEIPRSSTSDDKTVAKTIVQGIRLDEKGGVVFPEGWKPGTWPTIPSLVSSSDMIRRYNREMLMSFLAQFIDLGSTDVGSFALSADQSGLFLMSLEAEASEIAMVIDRYCIPQICAYNNLPITDNKYPKMKHQDLGRFDAKAFADVLNELSQSNWLPPREEMDEKFLRRKLNMPEPEDYSAPTIKDKLRDQFQQNIDSNQTPTTSKTSQDKVLPFQKKEKPPSTEDTARSPTPVKEGKIAMAEVGPELTEDEELKKMNKELSGIMAKALDKRERLLFEIEDSVWDEAVENSAKRSANT